MLVDQRRTSGGVAGPSHHPGRGGAELRGQSERGVPAVMEMEVAEPDLVPGGPPRPIHVVRPQRPPVGSGEDGGGRQAGSVGQPQRQGIHGLAGKVNDAPAGGLRLGFDGTAAGLDPLACNLDRAGSTYTASSFTVLCKDKLGIAPNAKPVTSPSSGAPIGRCLAGV